MITKPGLYPDISHSDYHADPCPAPSLSSSIARTLLGRSAQKAHYEHPRLGGGHREDDDTDAKDRGTILDSMLFGSGPPIARIDAKDYRTDAAKAAKAQARAAGAIPVIASKLDGFMDDAQAMKKRLQGAGIELSGMSQATIVWKVGDVWCRGRIDHWIPEQNLILDLKTSYDASPGGVDRSMNAYGADIQWAAYTSGLAAIFPQLAGRLKMRFAYCEPGPDGDISIAEPDGTLQELGTRRWNRAIEKWGACLASGIFPGYPREILRIGAKPWLLTQDMTQQINNMGNSNAELMGST